MFSFNSINVCGLLINIRFQKLKKNLTIRNQMALMLEIAVTTHIITITRFILNMRNVANHYVRLFTEVCHTKHGILPNSVDFERLLNSLHQRFL